MDLLRQPSLQAMDPTTWLRNTPFNPYKYILNKGSLGVGAEETCSHDPAHARIARGVLN